MDFRHIAFSVENDVALLTLMRPQSYNALIPEMFAEINEALNLLDRDKPVARCLLITGAGRGFCAGADLLEGIRPDPDNPPDLGWIIATYYAPLIKKLTYLPVPVVAAVNGAAAGAGMSIALACDIVIAARSAVFLQAFVNIGLIPDAGSTYLLPRLIGKARAAQLAMLGEKLSADKAESWGLIHKAVDDNLLMDEAMKIALKLAKGPTKALSMMRKAFALSAESSLEEQLECEAGMQKIAGYSKDFYEGVAAFTERRPAHFKGE